jgi:hypothetical protein
MGQQYLKGRTIRRVQFKTAEPIQRTEQPLHDDRGSGIGGSPEGGSIDQFQVAFHHSRQGIPIFFPKQTDASLPFPVHGGISGVQIIAPGSCMGINTEVRRFFTIQMIQASNEDRML